MAEHRKEEKYRLKEKAAELERKYRDKGIQMKVRIERNKTKIGKT